MVCVRRLSDVSFCYSVTHSIVGRRNVATHSRIVSFFLRRCPLRGSTATSSNQTTPSTTLTLSTRLIHSSSNSHLGYRLSASPSCTRYTTWRDLALRDPSSLRDVSIAPKQQRSSCLCSHSFVSVVDRSIDRIVYLCSAAIHWQSVTSS
jgi:hypothetical protein